MQPRRCKRGQLEKWGPTSARSCTLFFCHLNGQGILILAEVKLAFFPETDIWKWEVTFLFPETDLPVQILFFLGGEKNGQKLIKNVPSHTVFILFIDFSRLSDQSLIFLFFAFITFEIIYLCLLWQFLAFPTQDKGPLYKFLIQILPS